MKWYRIFAVFFRHWRELASNPDRWMEIFYWPLFDLLLWGITGNAMQLQAGGGSLSQVGVLIVVGMLLWLILQRTQHEVSIGFLTDMWDGNLTNLFISPLSFTEWFLAVVLISFVKMFLSFCFAAVMAVLLYQINIFMPGVELLPSMVLLLLFGWSLSAINIAVLFIFGSKAQAFSWILITFVAPFSAVYYSIAALPDWAKLIARLLPSSYALEAARQVFTVGTYDQQALLRGYALAVGYLMATLWLLKRAIYFSLQRGLFKNK